MSQDLTWNQVVTQKQRARLLGAIFKALNSLRASSELKDVAKKRICICPMDDRYQWIGEKNDRYRAERSMLEIDREGRIIETIRKDYALEGDGRGYEDIPKKVNDVELPDIFQFYEILPSDFASIQAKIEA